MGLRNLFLGGFLIIATGVEALPTGTFNCPPGLNCYFNSVTFANELGKTIIQGKLNVDNGSSFPFTLIANSERSAKGSLDVPYTNGAICSYEMDMEFEIIATGMKVLTQMPMSFPVYYQSCPQVGRSISIHDKIYLSEAAIARLGTLKNMTLLTNGNTDNVVIGSWQLNPEKKRVCNTSGIYKLQKTSFDCTAKSANIYSKEIDSKDLDPQYGSTDGNTTCFWFPAEQVDQLDQKIDFANQQQCRDIASQYSFGYLDPFYFNLKTKAAIAIDAVKRGDF